MLERSVRTLVKRNWQLFLRDGSSRRVGGAKGGGSWGGGVDQ